MAVLGTSLEETGPVASAWTKTWVRPPTLGRKARVKISTPMPPIQEEKARQNNALLSDTVVDVLTERLTGDIRQLESCVHNLLLKAKLLGCTISVEMAQEILAQYSLDDPFVDVVSIIRKVCEGFGLSPEQLASRSRKQNLVVARNTIFYLARKHTELSLQDIGDKFSRRHSTVLKGIASVERELRRESPLGRQIAGTLALLERR